jgi:diadenylate cyclase
MPGWLSGWQLFGRPFGLADAVDILLLAALIYGLARLIRGTRGVQMLTGLVLILLAERLTSALHLRGTHRVLTWIVAVIPFVVVVIFQNTIRRLLSALGRNPFFGALYSPASERLVDEVVLAASTLASKRIGALLVFERGQGLANFAETGIPIDGVLSYDLLINIFQPRTPLHDGAVIVREGRVVAAGCFLPLTADPHLSTEFGSRHRAAIGITEETDAVALVVSEERGTLSLAVNGEILRDLDARALRDELRRLFGPRLKAAAENPAPAGEPEREKASHP